MELFMQLYIIRHAETKNNVLFRETGSWVGRNEDTELSEKGHIQSKILAERLANSREFPFTHLYCSLMLRSVQTANYISDNIGLPLVAWADWHECGGVYLADYNSDGKECNQRTFPGKNRLYFVENYPNLILPENLGKHGWWSGRCYEGYDESCVRATGLLKELSSRHGSTSDQVAVVTHEKFYNIFMKVVLQISLNIDVAFTLDNTNITLLDFLPNKKVRLIYQNRMIYS
jgi:2,3-bisphosphoglycerate-dependent phosphoglycerate mutase